MDAQNKISFMFTVMVTKWGDDDDDEISILI